MLALACASACVPASGLVSTATAQGAGERIPQRLWLSLSLDSPSPGTIGYTRAVYYSPANLIFISRWGAAYELSQTRWRDHAFLAGGRASKGPFQVDAAIGLADVRFYEREGESVVIDTTKVRARAFSLGVAATASYVGVGLEFYSTQGASSHQTNVFAIVLHMGAVGARLR